MAETAASAARAEDGLAVVARGGYLSFHEVSPPVLTLVSGATSSSLLVFCGSEGPTSRGPFSGCQTLQLKHYESTIGTSAAAVYNKYEYSSSLPSGEWVLVMRSSWCSRGRRTVHDNHPHRNRPLCLDEVLLLCCWRSGFFDVEFYLQDGIGISGIESSVLVRILL